jgi:glutathione S-transferase
MLLLDSIGPNPKTVRMFIAERGITGIPVQTVDLRGGENRQPPYLAKNPAGQCPTLQLDDGSYLTEITAICEYLDEIAPRIRCIPQAADDLKALAKEKLVWLNGLIAGRPFIGGDRLTLADIMLFAFLQFAATVRQPPGSGEYQSDHVV